MSQSHPDMSTEQPDGSNPQHPHRPVAEQRQQTTADSRPLKLQQEASTTSSIGRHATARPGQSARSRPTHERNNTASLKMPRSLTNRTNQTLQTTTTQDPNERSEKKQEQTVDIDNEYFRLNPWYNQKKDKPVFGLAAPLPRTVRRGMWWGRGGLRKSLQDVEEENREQGVEAHDGLYLGKAKDLDKDSDDTEVFPEDEQTDYFQPRGYNANIRRRPTGEPEETPHDRGHDHEGRDRAPVDEHGLSYSGSKGQPQHFGMQDGLPPLQELDTNATTQTQKEKKEVQHREHQAEQEFYNQYRNPIARLRAKYPQAPAEFLATFVYLFLGICCNLSIATSQKTTGSFETQAWGWGFAVMVGIYLGGGVSGAHLSPTISIALSIYRGFPWKMALVYIAMQMLAGLCAGALAYALYRDAIHAVDPGLTLELTGSALFPKGPIYTTVTGFFNDFVFMAIYVCIAFALGDDQNSPPGQGMTALVFGFTGFVTMVALGYNTGLGISPARDLGPRLVGLWAGYDEAFSTAYWAYGSWGASIGGALFGGLIYDLFIFVGGESPVNYRWPEPGDIKWQLRETKEQTKDKIQRIA